MSHDHAYLGTAELDPATRALLVQCTGAPVDDDGTAPDFGRLPVMSQLGVIAMPYPSSDAGSAEAVIANDVPGYGWVVVGMRDVRCSTVAGNLKPGDVCFHACDPQHVAQIQLKGTRRQAAFLSEDSKKRTQMFLLDGSNDKSQWAVSGALIQIDEKGNISLTSADGSGLLIGNGMIRVVGKFIAGQPKPGFALMEGPMIGSPGGILTPPMFAAMGISVG